MQITSIQWGWKEIEGELRHAAFFRTSWGHQLRIQYLVLLRQSHGMNLPTKPISMLVKSLIALLILLLHMLICHIVLIWFSLKPLWPCLSHALPMF